MESSPRGRDKAITWSHGITRMTPETRAWLDGLRDSAAAHRARRPAAAAVLPAAEAAERAILAADLATRLPAFRDGLAAARATATRPGDPDPAVVITTSPVGITVFAGLLASPSHVLEPLAARAAAVTELEYRLWCIRHPDDAHRLHVNIWSWVKTRVPQQRWPEFARHPLGPGETYWLHRTGAAGAGPLDGRHCHLWKWNGRHAALLEAFIHERAVGPLDADGDRGGRH